MAGWATAIPIVLNLLQSMGQRQQAGKRADREMTFLPPQQPQAPPVIFPYGRGAGNIPISYPWSSQVQPTQPDFGYGQQGQRTGGIDIGTILNLIASLQGDGDTWNRAPSGYYLT